MGFSAPREDPAGLWKLPTSLSLSEPPSYWAGLQPLGSVVSPALLPPPHSHATRRP